MEIDWVSWTRCRKDVVFAIYIMIENSMLMMLMSLSILSTLCISAHHAHASEHSEHIMHQCSCAKTLWALSVHEVLTWCVSPDLTRNIIPSLPYSCPREFLMSRFKTSSSTDRRNNLFSTLNVEISIMRLCKNCANENKWCRLTEEFEKCVECVESTVSYDLIPFNVFKWRRLKNQRRKLKTKLREACAKQQRLLHQIDSLKNKQKKMIDAELQNIEELKK